MTPENATLGQNFAHLDIWVESVSFGTLGGSKSRFVYFFKELQELFKLCLVIVFGLKRPYFCADFYSRLTSKLHTLIWGPAEALLKFYYASAGLFI